MDSNALMYVTLGVVYVVLFIVIGSYLVMRQRRNDTQIPKEEILTKSDEKEEPSDGNRKRVRLDNIQHISEDSKEPLEPTEEATNRDKKED